MSDIGSHSRLGSGNRSFPEPMFPPRVWWAPWKGWLYCQDPISSEVHAIQARDAPTGWARIASEAKHGRNR